MSEYQPFARKYRPQIFADVLGQTSTVTTLKNAIANKRLAHAYLFCGSRGTGKTTLARLFAKALNCSNLTSDHEPCNQCSSCKEIGSTLDVLEIDGASNRGIDDIRKINETVGYRVASGKYKIYIIDEVHMLTKEAFNALLKTLEEPPPQVKFFFATTEPHQVPTTIRSRCQRFNLNRIATETIIEKLQRIVQDVGVNAEEEALRLITHRAEGGLRDAESLLDQVLTFHEKEVTAHSVASALGTMPRDVIFELDHAGKEGDLAVAFTIANRVFSEGKDLPHFLEMLAEHFRHILVVKFCGKNAPMLSLSDTDREKYAEIATFYRQEQCLSLLDYLITMQHQLRYVSSERIALEAILLHIMRSHQRVPIDILVHRLSELESQHHSSAKTSLPTTANSTPPTATDSRPPSKMVSAAQPKETANSTPPTITDSRPPSKMEPAAQPKKTANSTPPTITDSRPPSKMVPAAQPKETANSTPPTTTDSRPPSKMVPVTQPKETANSTKHNHGQHDTLLQFAAVELEGTIKR